MPAGSQRIADAISSGAPTRPIGMPGATRAGRSGSPPAAWMPVCTVPGATALTRMPARDLAREAAGESLDRGLGRGVVHVLAGAAGRGGDSRRG